MAWVARLYEMAVARWRQAEPEYLLINGLIALALSLGLWKLTGSYAGWLVLFVPGSALVLAGIARIIF